MSERFSDVHRRYVIEGDPTATCEQIITALRLRQDLREVLYELILGACESYDRSRVRRVEQQAYGSGTKVDPLAKSQLVVETFPLPGGRRVSWGEATVDDHLARVEMLSKLRDGVQATIDRHLAAIELLRSTGINSLGEAA